MTWCGDTSVFERAIQLVSSTNATPKENVLPIVAGPNNDDRRTLTCPSCGHNIEIRDQAGIHDLPGLPSGVKFDPTDQEILEHLEGKILSDTRKIHPLIDEFIPTIEGEDGICYTHPEKLPGVSNDGQIRHFFHRPSKAYTTGTRKRRKVQSDDDGSETRWHKTGKTRPVLVGGSVKGFKKILVLYTNYGRQRKPEKTNWVMHQYHLGSSEEEKDGELVVSKVFYQTQPRQCGSHNVKDSSSSLLLLDHHQNMKNKSSSSNNTNNTTALVDYYSSSGANNTATPFISYDHQNRENPTQFIPNLVVQSDHHGTSFIRLAAPDHTSKGQIHERK